MLILRDTQQRVLLQRRGAGGVWSGLWSLPETNEITNAARDAAKFAGVNGSRAEHLPPFLHTFTHYRLHAQPLLWRGVHAAHAIADSPDTRWCAREDCERLGIPAPVRKLLNEIDEVPA
jgi:A/G-specific adenine glycosylase